MTGHRQYKVTDYRFGQMILSLREKIGLTQMEVADALSVSRRTIQNWEGGTTFPDAVHLKKLIAFYLEQGSFTRGLESDEAAAVWTQADESAARRKSLFDTHWFKDLLQRQAKPAGSSSVPGKERPGSHAPRIDWGDAPDLIQVFGREKEIAELANWVIDERCRLVAVLGMGGIGKTTLAVKFAQDYAANFEYIIWRSLHNAPALPDLLLEMFQILSPVHPTKPSIQFLLELLQQHRCLVILDNAETLHRTGNLSGEYREGFEEYQRFFQTVAQARHQSCLILTSREWPAELEMIEGKNSPVRVMKVPGLTSAAGQSLLIDRGLVGSQGTWDVFINYYTGNPLALKIAAATVHDLFNGDLAAFLREAPVTLHTLNQLLSNQFEHLSALEQGILFWLAIERDPADLQTLRGDFLTAIPNPEILSGLRSLLQRSLIERSEQGAFFSLLPVLLEFITDRLVATVTEEINIGKLELITRFSLIKSQSIDQIRESQVRMILLPVLALLKRHFGSQEALAEHLRNLTRTVRGLPRDAQGYSGGNLLNLVAQLNGNIRGEDFSGLALRQVFLQGIDAQDSNFHGVGFSDSRFTEPLETISAIALSPDGALLVASTLNGHIRCWNVADGKPVWTVTNAGRAWSLAFSPDETILASSHYRGRVSLWDVATGRPLHTFEGHRAWVHTVAFHPDGKLLASAGTDTQVCLWDVQQKTLVQVLKGHKSRIWSLAFSPEGKLLVSAADEESIHVWDADSGALLRLLPHPSKGVIQVAFHPNGQWLASCCEQDPHIVLWDVNSGERIANLTSRSSGPASVAFNPEGDILISGGRDGSVELWQVGDQKHMRYIKMLVGHQHLVNDISTSRGGLLATLSFGENIKVWNVESGKLLRVFEGYNRMIAADAFSPDASLLVQGDASGRIRIWDVPGRRYLNTFQGHTGPIWAVDFCQDGKSFVTVGDDRAVRVWDTASLNCVKTFLEKIGQMWCVTFSQDGTLLASGGTPYGIIVWDAYPGTGAEGIRWFDTQEDVWTLAFDRAGKTLASGHTAGTVILWDIISGQIKRILQHGSEPVGAIRFSDDGKTLYTSSNQPLLIAWDLETGKRLFSDPNSVDGNRTRAVAIGKEGKLVATGSRGEAVYLWRADPNGIFGEPVTVKGHTTRVWGFALSADERYLASSDEEGTTLLSDAQTGEVLERILIDRPYERMKIGGVTGLNVAEYAALKALGAINSEPSAG